MSMEQKMQEQIEGALHNEKENVEDRLPEVSFVTFKSIC